jgi:hypothetical protein
MMKETTVPLALSPIVVAKIGMSCSRRTDSACPQDAFAASVPMSTIGGKMVEYQVLRHPRDIESCTLLSSSLG